MFKKILIYGLTFLLGIAILPVTIAINNAVNVDNVKTVHVKKIDLNDIEFTKLAYYQSNDVYYVAEVENYFVVVQDYVNESSPNIQSIVNDEGKFIYVSSSEESVGTSRGKVFIFDSIREDKGLFATLGEENFNFTTF